MLRLLPLARAAAFHGSARPLCVTAAAAASSLSSSSLRAAPRALPPPPALSRGCSSKSASERVHGKLGTEDVSSKAMRRRLSERDRATAPVVQHEQAPPEAPPAASLWSTQQQQQLASWANTPPPQGGQPSLIQVMTTYLVAGLVSTGARTASLAMRRFKRSLWGGPHARVHGYCVPRPQHLTLTLLPAQGMGLAFALVRLVLGF